MDAAIANVEQSVRRLAERWETTGNGWRDDGAERFSVEFVEPLKRDGVTTTALLKSLASILDNARRIAP